MDTTSYKVGQTVKILQETGVFGVGTKAKVFKIEHGMVHVEIGDHTRIRIEHPGIIGPQFDHVGEGDATGSIV